MPGWRLPPVSRVRVLTLYRQRNNHCLLPGYYPYAIERMEDDKEHGFTHR